MQSRIGDLERLLGNPSAAREWYERAIVTFQKFDDRNSLARTMVDVAALSFEQGNEREAHTIMAD